MAAQPGGSALPDVAAVPVADGRADDHTEKVRQTSGAAGIHGVILCKTEKFSSGFRNPQAACPEGMGMPCTRPDRFLAAPKVDGVSGRDPAGQTARRQRIRRIIHRHYDGHRTQPGSQKSRISGIIKPSSTKRRHNGFPVYGRKTEQP